MKLSEELALEVSFPGEGRPDPEWLRLVGATVQHYRAGSWAEGRRSRQLVQGGEAGVVALAPPDPRLPIVRAEIVLRKNSEHLFLPAGTVALEPPLDVPASRDRLGTVTIPRRAETPISYAVAFQPGRAVQRPPEPEDVALPPGSEPIRELAAQIVGGAHGRVAAALAVESHLRSAYTYSTSTFAPVRQDPVLWFLFDSRQGHCEFFASSMVMLLRALDIPARLQAGYAGGEGDGRGGFLVRESQAHAWVVAWLGDRWTVFDPTPAEGRPELVGEGVGWSLAGGWRQLEAAWDRWVLTFSLADQVDLVRQAGPALRAAAARWRTMLAALVAVAVAAVLARTLARLLPRLATARRRGLGGALERRRRARAAAPAHRRRGGHAAASRAGDRRCRAGGAVAAALAGREARALALRRRRAAGARRGHAGEPGGRPRPGAPSPATGIGPISRPATTRVMAVRGTAASTSTT